MSEPSIRQKGMELLIKVGELKGQAGRLASYEARIAELESHDYTRHEVAHRLAGTLVDFILSRSWSVWISRSMFCTAIRDGAACEGEESE
jgi:hypothetical protein